MSRIVRISHPVFPKLPVRTKAEQAEETVPASHDIKIINPGHQARSRRRIPARPGPSSAFLAQYVDQHWPWPRDADARVRARVTAASAYDEANDIPLSEDRGSCLNRKF